MLAEEIIALDFGNSAIRKRLEVYFYGLAASRGYLIDFGQLRNVLSKISADEEETTACLRSLSRDSRTVLPEFTERIMRGRYI